MRVTSASRLRITRIAGQLVNRQHIFHRRDERGIAVGRNFPTFAQVRLRPIFLATAARSRSRDGRRSSAPRVSLPQSHRPALASRRRFRASEGGEPRTKLSVEFHGSRLVRGLRTKAASTSSSTKRCAMCSIVREPTPKAIATSATFPGSPNFPGSHRSEARE